MRLEAALYRVEPSAVQGFGMFWSYHWFYVEYGFCGVLSDGMDRLDRR